ncbi:pimeloyl-[acyl-carrier protein] methyl ester esterase [Marinobacter sp. es.048]|uniref:carboxylesterase n=1 Tax=Marinobacter sp. es.048 TaxID=1761795 RepID=UPI000B591E61|nr:carboxylesterase [Marinobacter sp. es.048]SNC66674.1 pimeloyl-[acyl-carrier protein] methyl ester esterase [Marinobacter sp. es.048]
MSSCRVCPRLVVVAGWGVRAEMLSELYGYWPGKVVQVSLDDELLVRCRSLSEVTDELLSLYPEPSVWMGWSLGSQVVMEAAARETGAVSVAITLGGFPKFVADGSWPHGMPARDFQAFALGIRRDPQRHWLHFLLLMINGAVDEKQERQRLKPWREKGTLVSHEHLCKSLAWLEAGDQRALWRSLTTPALHIIGERVIVVRSRAEDLSVPASSSHVVVSGMAHWPGGCSASDCWGAMQTFLASRRDLSWAL